MDRGKIYLQRLKVGGRCEETRDIKEGENRGVQRGVRQTVGKLKCGSMQYGEKETGKRRAEQKQ